MKSVIKITLSLIVCISIINCCFAMVVMGAEGSNLAKFVLDKMVENRNKVENFKCISEKLIYNSEKERQSLYDMMIEDDFPKEQAEKHLNKVYDYRILNLALDNKGCGKVQLIIKEADTEGNLTGKETIKKIMTWNGKNSIDYQEEPESSYATVGGNEPSLFLTDHYDQPWRTFGGNFCDYLKSALVRNEKVNIEKQKDGTYRVEFLYPEDSRKIGLIDPNQGYSVILQEVYYEGKINSTYKALFREVKPGIWFPVSGESIHSNPAEPSSTTTMKVKEIKINDPNFYDGLYKVDFKEGTLVSDRISGINYVVSEQ